MITEPHKRPFPVIFYSPSGSIVDNTTLFQERTSHGYIVLSVGHPYWKMLSQYMPREVADIRLLAGDISFLMNHIEYHTLDQGTFLENIETSKVGVIGFSKGGAAAGQFCVSDNRCKAGINLSGFMFGDTVENAFSEPFMIMESVFKNPE